MLDQTHLICEWNEWLVNLTGITRKKASHKTLGDLFSEVNTSRFQFSIEQVLLHKHPQVLSQILNRYLIPISISKASVADDIEYMQQSVAIFPIELEQEIYAMVVIQDVTEDYRQRHVLLQVAKRFEEESIRDELTGLYNRRFLWEYLESELPKASREKYYLVCTVYDLDHFKAVNDDLGHKAGDEILLSFVGVIKKNLRAGDSAFRYGGEEFITISSDVDLKKPNALAQRICTAMAAKKLHGAVKRVVTCSAGFSIAQPLYVPLASESLVKHADEALYRAKKEGRNRVCTYQEGVEVITSSKELKLINFGHVKKITRDDKALQKELYHVFNTEVLEQATQLKKIFLSEKSDAVVKVMHALKASAKAVGAEPLALGAETLEFAARANDFEKIKTLEVDFLDLLYKTVESIEKYLKSH